MRKTILGLMALLLVACGGGGGTGHTAATTVSVPAADRAAIEQFAELEADSTHPDATTKGVAGTLLGQISDACQGYSLTRSANEAADLARELHQRGADLAYFDTAREWLQEIKKEPGGGLDCHRAALVLQVYGT